MRISDWSSDVCSSDLTQSHKDRIEGGKGQDRRQCDEDRPDDPFHQSMSVRRLGRSRKRKADIEDPPPRPAPRLRIGDRRFEIGRASCRERVCPYVCISVVAGSLKKKKTTKITQ